MSKKVQAFIAFTTLLLVACGENRAPVAFSAVDPLLDETGVVQRIADQLPSGEVLTLINAVLLQGVPAKVAKEAMLKFDRFEARVRNPGHIVMIDFTQHSGKKRFYLVDRKSGKVDTLTTAHGEASDPDNDGTPQYFSNVPNSHMSSLGAYLISEKYVGKYGESLKLDGLERTNSNARARVIVLHPSHYVKDGKAKQGRSWGCPAVPYAWIKKIIQRTQDGAFMYIYGINKRNVAEDRYLIQQWNLIPKSQWINEADDAPWDGA
ncbi:MAG: murein L,D-transpeptidase catalytic domain family protein [Bdellovibrionales bacterium]